MKVLTQPNTCIYCGWEADVPLSLFWATVRCRDVKACEERQVQRKEKGCSR